MNVLDWILIGVASFAVLRGMMRGAISQIFGIAGILCGFYAAFFYYHDLGGKLSGSFRQLTGSEAEIAAFIVLFFLTYICIAIMGSLAASIFRSTGLGYIDRFWGAGVGLAKAFVFAVLLISTLTVLLDPANPLLAGSSITPYVQEAGKYAVQAAPERVQSLFREKQEQLKRYWLDKQGHERKPDRL